MSTAVVSLVSFAVMITAIVTLLNAVFDSSAEVTEAWLDDAKNEQSASFAHVVATSATVSGDAQRTVVDVTLKNRGDRAYARFKKWDVNVEYVDTSGDLVTSWLAYSEEAADDAWTVKGIYLDAAKETSEVVGPGVLNADEEMVVRVRVTPPANDGSTGRVVLTPPEGSPASVFFSG